MLEMDLSQVVVKAELLNCVREEKESSISKKASTEAYQSCCLYFETSMTLDVFRAQLVRESIENLYPM